MKKFAAVVFLLGIALLWIGGCGGSNRSSTAGVLDDSQMEVCHSPDGDPASAVTLLVTEAEAELLMVEGATPGPCAEGDPGDDDPGDDPGDDDPGEDDTEDDKDDWSDDLSDDKDDKDSRSVDKDSKSDKDS